MNEKATIEWTDAEGKHHFKKMSFNSCMKYMRWVKAHGGSDIIIFAGKMKVVG